MKPNKYNIICSHIQRLSWYSVYVDCFMRILNEFLTNGDSNLKPTDVQNLSELLAALARQQKIITSKLLTDWEFYK